MIDCEILMKELNITSVPLYEMDQRLDTDLRVLKSKDMEEWYKTEDPWVSKKDGAFDPKIIQALRCQFIVDVLGLGSMPTISSIIDIGGGEGQMLAMVRDFMTKSNLLATNPKLLSIDISQTACDRAKLLDLSAVVIDIEKDIPSYKYDVVMIIGVLYYLDNWKLGAKYCFDSVADGGYIFVSDSMIRYYQRESFGRNFGMKEVNRTYLPVMKIIKKNGKIEHRTEKLIAYQKI